MMPATPRSSSIPQAAATSPNARCRVRSGMICRSRASSSASISAAVPTYRSETIFGRPPTRAISRKYQYVLPLIFFGYRLAINLGHTPEQPRGQAPNQRATSRNASASASHWASDNHDHRKLRLAAVDDVGEGLDDELAGGGAGVLVVFGALAEVAGAALAGDQGDGRPHALLGGGGGAVQRGPELDALGDRLVQGAQRGVPGVEHGLVANLGLAPSDHGVGGLLGGAELLAHPQVERPVQRPGRAADLADQRHADRPEHAREILVGQAVEPLQHRAEPPNH